jgi:probable addiction module antidote protein
MSQLALDTGLTREGLYKALSSDGNPSFATVAKVCTALGLRMTFTPAHAAAH